MLIKSRSESEESSHWRDHVTSFANQIPEIPSIKCDDRIVYLLTEFRSLHSHCQADHLSIQNILDSNLKAVYRRLSQR